MGISLTSIHIYSDEVPDGLELPFRSFSSHWLTCTEDLLEQDLGYSSRAAKRISKSTDAPVLHFGVFDSEMIWFEFLRNGKVISRYSDGVLGHNRKLYDIPGMVGYEEGNKKRLSTILACSDVDMKIAMLEEYLGVCLLYLPDLEDEPEMLFRKQDDALFRAHCAEEKALKGKNAPMACRMIGEYPGKLFYCAFGPEHTKKPHYFLYGYLNGEYTPEYHKLTPVRFTGTALENTDSETFGQDRIPLYTKDDRFQIQFGTPSRVTFSEGCPPDFRGKTMALPSGFYPLDFLPSGELLLEGNHQISVVGSELKIVAKLSVKGDVSDVLGNHLLTTTGDSFCGYCYEPKAKIRIYEIIKQ